MLPTPSGPKAAVHRRTPTGTLKAAALFAALLATACDPSKRAQCNGLVEAIGAHVPSLGAAIEDLSEVQRDATVADRLRAAAADADRDLVAVELSDPRLVALARGYREQLAAAKALADKLASADSDTTQLHGAVLGADAFIARQAETLRDLNDYCATKR